MTQSILRRIRSTGQKGKGSSITGAPAPARCPFQLSAIFERQKRLNLALQGGGAHGAFTWGVLDRLLLEDRLRFDGVSGTSAGAVNAVALAAGLMEGGREGARRKLADIWAAVGALSGCGFAFGQLFIMHIAFRQMSKAMSPYEVCPANINPLGDILRDHIDFDGLRRSSPVELFIAATEVSTGRAQIFRTSEISAEVILASACLPNLFKAVKIGSSHYWDGGFSANPDLINLIEHSKTDDTLLVQLNPNRDPNLPRRTDEIAGSINRITFNQPLSREVELIQKLRGSVHIPLIGTRLERRLRSHRFHTIAAEAYTSRLDPDSRLKPHRRLLNGLYQAGRKETQYWLAEYGGEIGRRSTVDLYDKIVNREIAATA